MLKNHNHDLVHHLSETLDSLWRYEGYLKNAEGCDHCTKVWQKCKEHDEHIHNLLVEEIKRHMSEGRFN